MLETREIKSSLPFLARTRNGGVGAGIVVVCRRSAGPVINEEGWKDFFIFISGGRLSDV